MDWINISQLSELKPGDTVRGKVTGVSFLVTGNYGDHVTAVKTVDITHADEWELMIPE